ncbi:MAG: hypothetical protein HYX93_06170 [Chloroflexi bacterium]|nr:hypothetical protein [Chloroflexota bacterium]
MRAEGQPMNMWRGSYRDLPLMPEEEVILCFGERSGLRASVGRDPHSVILTDRRVIKLARGSSNLEVTFISLKDAQVAEVRDTRRRIKPLLRVGLLAAGALAALQVVPAAPLAWALAIVLGIGSLFHLIRYIRSVEDGSLLIRGGQNEVGIPFKHGKAGQAYAFVNRFFEVKLSPPTKEEEGPREDVRPDMPGAEAMVDTRGEEEVGRQGRGEGEHPPSVLWSSAAEGHSEEPADGLDRTSAWPDAPSSREDAPGGQGPDPEGGDGSQRDAS